MSDDNPPTPRRVRKRTVAALPKPEPVEPLAPGDTVEVSLTAAVKHPRKGEFWVKGGAMSKVRDGETTQQATERVGAYVFNLTSELARDVLE